MTVAIYKQTKSLHLAEKEKSIVLQLLSKKQIGLVKTLGFKSGHEVDKIGILEKKGLLINWNDFKVLKDALAYILLKEKRKIDAGDHIVFLYDVKAFYNNQEGEELTLNELRNKKLIRG